MLIKNSNNHFISNLSRKSKGGYIISTTTNLDQAFDFVTGNIFDALEILNDSFPNEGWIAVDKEE